MSLTGRCDRQRSALDSESGRSFPSLSTLSKHSNYPRGFFMFYLRCVPRARYGLRDKRTHAPALLSTSHARREAYLKQHRRHILLRRLGVRNKSDTSGLVWAASSSSCMMALKTFNNNINNNTLFSCRSMVGTARSQAQDKMDHFPSRLLFIAASEDAFTDLKGACKANWSVKEASRRLCSNKHI